MGAAHDVGARSFSTAVVGYDRRQVEDFREEMAAVIGRLRSRVSELEHELREHEQAKPITADQAFAHVARETQRILQAAQEGAARIVAQAREEAEREVATARREHSQIVGEGYRTRDQMGEQLEQLDRARAALLQRLYDASADIEQVCTALESDPPVARPRNSLPQPLVERHTGTEPARRTGRSGEPTLRVVDNGPREGGRVRTLPSGGGRRSRSTDPVTDKRDRLAPLRAPLTDRLGTELEAVRDDLRERLRRAADQSSDRADVGFDDTAVARVADAGRDLLTRAFEIGAAAAAGGAEVTVAAPGDEHRPELLEVLDARIGAPVRTLMEESRAANDPPWVVAERIEGIFSDVAEAMVTEITDTELSRSYERGMLATWSEAGVAARRWVLSPKGHRRDDRCRRNADAGAVPLGEPFPSGEYEPPRFSGCTCTTIAADKEEHEP